MFKNNWHFLLSIIYLEVGLDKSDVKCSGSPPPPLLSTSHPIHPKCIENKWGLKRKGNCFSLYLLRFLNLYLPCVQVILLKSYYLKSAFSVATPAGCGSLAHRSVPEPNGMASSLCLLGSRSTQVYWWSEIPQPWICLIS